MNTHTYTFFQDGFFGYGEANDFKMWSIAHFAPILIMLLTILLIYKYRNSIRKYKNEENIRYGLACFMLFVEASYWWRLLYTGDGGYLQDNPTLLARLPLQVCQWTLIICSFVLMKKSKSLFPICYYLSLTCGVVPLFTPGVISTTGPAYYRYYQFWLEHILPIISVFYLIFIHNFRVSLKDIYKPLLFGSAMAIIAIYLNKKIPYANYLYLQNNTPGFTLANFLPKSIYLRLLIYSLIIITGFFIVYIPMHYLNKKDKENGII